MLTVYVATTFGVFLLSLVFSRSSEPYILTPKKRNIFLVAGGLLLLTAIAILATEIIAGESHFGLIRSIRRLAGNFTLMFLLGTLSGVLIFDASRYMFSRKDRIDTSSLLRHPVLYVIVGSIALSGVITSIETPFVSVKVRDILEAVSSVDTRALSFSEPEIRVHEFSSIKLLLLDPEPMVEKDISFYKLFPEKYKDRLDERKLAQAFNLHFWKPLSKCLRVLKEHFTLRELTNELFMPVLTLRTTLRIAQENPDRELSALPDFPMAMSKMWGRLAKFHKGIGFFEETKGQIPTSCPETKTDWPQEFSKAGDLDQTVSPRMFLAVMMMAVEDYENTREVLLGGNFYDRKDSVIYKKFAYDFNYLNLIISLQRREQYPRWYTTKLQEDYLFVIQAFVREVESYCPGNAI